MVRFGAGSWSRCHWRPHQRADPVGRASTHPKAENQTLAVLSTGEEVPNPRHLSGALRKLRRLSRTMARRQGPARRAGQRPSNRWRRASAAVAKAHGRVADQRRDGLHKLTTRLAAEFGTIAVEDLHVAAMARNRRPVRADLRLRVVRPRP
jgi:transposase